MKIRCSGEVYDDPIETQTCLDCALARGNRPPCGYSYPLLKAIFESQAGDRSTEAHVSDVLSCLRKAYYTKVEPEPRYVHDMMVLWQGISIHKAIEEAMRDEPGWQVEKEVQDGDLLGRIDVITPDGTIIDQKTTRWMKPSNLPYGNHREQVQIYQQMAGLDGDMLIQYIDMSGPSRCRRCSVSMQMTSGEVVCPKCGSTSPEAHLGAIVKRVKAKDIEERTKLRTVILKTAMESKSVPDAEPDWMCRYCPFTERCPEAMI